MGNKYPIKINDIAKNLKTSSVLYIKIILILSHCLESVGGFYSSKIAVTVPMELQGPRRPDQILYFFK